MTPDLYWLPSLKPLRLAILPRPRGGEELAGEIRALRERGGVTMLASLLETAEIRERGLADEPRHCVQSGIQFRHFPIADRGVPRSLEQAHALAAELVAQLQAGEGVAIHCRAGIGRSGLIAGCVLAQLGIAPAQALRLLSAARRVSVPDTPEQEEWLSRYARGLKKNPQTP